MKIRATAGIALWALIAWLLIPSALAQDHAQHYVLDAFGGVHAGGGAPLIHPGTPYFGFDAAADLVYVPVGNATAAGDGILVLDKFGGVHRGGALVAAPPVGATPYFGFDAARAIVYRDVPVRAAGSVGSGVDLMAPGYQTLTSLAIYAPDDGFLLVTGTSYMSCLNDDPATQLVGRLITDVDSTDYSPTSAGLATWDGCTAPMGYYPTHSRSVTHLFPVTAGEHVVNLTMVYVVGSMEPAILRGLSPTLTAVFVDQNHAGLSAPIDLDARPYERIGR